MPLNLRNLAAIRQRDPQLAEALDDISAALSVTAQQTNANPQGTPPQPPQVGALKVSAAAGIFQATITDNAPVARGVSYFLEHSDTPNFAQPHVIALGPSRTWRGALGNQKRYWRAYSQYPTGSPSAPVYHGSSVAPAAVDGGGSASGPAIPPSTGSGTAETNGRQGGAGFGQVATRGTPPQPSGGQLL